MKLIIFFKNLILEIQQYWEEKSIWFCEVKLSVNYVSRNKGPKITKMFLKKHWQLRACPVRYPELVVNGN